MNPERNRENNEIQEINQPKQVELTNAEKDEMKRDLEANPPTLDHQGELEQVKGKVDGQDKRQEEKKTLTNTEDVKNQDDGENKNSKEDAKANLDAQNDVGDKNTRLERTETQPKLDVEHVAGHPKDMLVHENGKTRELTKEEVEAIDKKVEEVEKERAEQKAATEKEYAEKLKGVEPDTQEYYALQKEKADKLEAIDKEYDKKGDEVEILKDLYKQGDKPGEGSEKGKTSDISVDKDELKTATPEEKQPNPEAGTRESKEDTKPEQDNVQETGDTTENNRESNNVKENLDENNEKPKLDVEHVAGHPKDMLVHENGKTRELTKEEVEAIDKKVEEVEKERAEQKAATEKEYAEKLKGVEPDTQEYYALQKEKADRLEAIDKEYDKKGDEVEILKDLYKQGDKPGEGSEKGKTSDISVDKDELKTATPEEKQPNPEAGTRESKEDTKPEQDNVQETGDTTENNRESNNVKENLDENNEKPKLDVEHVAGHPKDMLVHENGKTRELTKEEVEAIDKKVEEVEKERAEQKAATEKEYAEKLKGVEPDTQEYYALQKEKADRLEAIDKEYDKKGDEVEILKDLHKQSDKSGEGSEKGKTSDISVDKDELKTATPEEKQPNPEAGTRESKEDTKPEQDNVQETGDKTENNRENNTVKETAEGENEKPKLDVEHVAGHPKDMLVHENGKTRELTKEEVEAIDKKVEEVEKERAEQKAATEKEYAEKLKGVEPDTQEYYALQKEKADKLEAIDKEYDKKGDEVEILKDLHKQSDKSGEGSEKGKTSDISVDKDELKTATPEEKQPNPEAGTRESKEDTKPEQGNVQETGDTTENNRESNNVKENLDENNEKPKQDVEKEGKVSVLSTELKNGIKDINKNRYEEAKQLAQKSEVGRNFTDHTEKHIEQVAEKSLEAANAIEDALKTNNFIKKGDGPDYIEFKGNIDKKSLEGAALCHDTGMAGDGYALKVVYDEKGEPVKDIDGKVVYEKDENGNYVVEKCDKDNYNEVRSNHSLNSALNVLENREQLKELGYTDEQVDTMAAECMAHSKTNSGVNDLNSKKAWADCFDRIETSVEAYNQDHKDAPINFDRTIFEKDGQKLGQLANSTLALRIGDVSRDSGPDAISQSGDVVHVERETVNNEGKNLEDEISNAKVTCGGEEVTNLKSKQVHIGEQNIVKNHTYCAEDGSIHHQIAVNDADFAPFSTIKAIEDHLGELGSAKSAEFNLEINFNNEYSLEAKDTYEDYREKFAEDYPNVNIHFPWDEEG